MAKRLGPENYGILGSLLSLLYIFSVPSSVVSTTLTQIVSEQKGREEYGKIKSIFILSAQKLAYFGLLIFLILILFSKIIKNLLNLPSEIPVILLGFSLIFITIIPSPRGILQGIQEFNNLGFNMAIEKPALLFFGALFIYLGMGVNGAVLSYGAGAIVVLVSSIMPLRCILGKQSEKVSSSVYEYAFPILILTLCITIMSSIDIFFVRRYFTAEISGYFTSLKMMGEMIYFLSLALAGVLLPKVSELNTLNKAHSYLLKKAIIYFGIVLFCIVSVYAIAPDIIITLLFGKSYSSISGYLVWYTMAMGLLSLAIILMFYNVSVKRTAFKYPLILLTMLEVAWLVMFHETLEQIIIVQMATFLLLLVSVIVINIRYESHTPEKMSMS